MQIFRTSPPALRTWCSVWWLLLRREKQFSPGWICESLRPHDSCACCTSWMLFFWLALHTEQRAAAVAAWGETVCAAATAQNNTTCRAVTQQWQAANKPGVHVAHQVSSYERLLWLAGRYFILSVTRHPEAPECCPASCDLLLFLSSAGCLKPLLQVSYYFLLNLRVPECLDSTSDRLRKT